ncbi:MAG: hypothetical protein Q9227_006494 [Pyrenula ochraceoflavens]
MRSHSTARSFLLRCRQSPSVQRRRSNAPYYALFPHRSFHATPPYLAIKTQKLTDIGEGNKEVQIIQWYVTEGARVEEWDNLCQVQSDKAADDITARYAGVVKKLYWQSDDTVQTGQPLVDIDVFGSQDANEDVEGEASQLQNEKEEVREDTGEDPQDEALPASTEAKEEPKGKHATLATPAVRGLLKEHNLQITDVRGTGRDGRVLKEDVYTHLQAKSSPQAQRAISRPQPALTTQTETPHPLNTIQRQMYQTMTTSLQIPQFLYTHSVNLTSLSLLRKQLNATLSRDIHPHLTTLPFIVKAVSLSLNHYPILNSRAETTSSPSTPPKNFLYRSQHNIGIAMATPGGLVVPVIHDVASHSILSLASEISRLSGLGAEGRLSSADMSGGTITVSNIGSIGGNVVAPVILEGQVAIMGVGKARPEPIWKDGGGGGGVERAEILPVSWSADHRVVDGVTMAQMAEKVGWYLEDVGRMGVEMR